MPKVRVRAFLNETPGHRFDHYESGDDLRAFVDLQFEGSAYRTQVMALLERVFAVGNRHGADDEGKQWPGDVRSLSVGDVVAVSPYDSDEQTYYEVDSFGFNPIRAELVCDCGKGTLCPQYGIDFKPGTYGTTTAGVEAMLRREIDERIRIALDPFLAEVAVSPEHRLIVYDAAQDTVNAYLSAWPNLPVKEPAHA